MSRVDCSGRCCYVEISSSSSRDHDHQESRSVGSCDETYNGREGAICTIKDIEKVTSFEALVKEHPFMMMGLENLFSLVPPGLKLDCAKRFMKGDVLLPKTLPQGGHLTDLVEHRFEICIKPMEIHTCWSKTRSRGKSEGETFVPADKQMIYEEKKRIQNRVKKGIY